MSNGNDTFFPYEEPKRTPFLEGRQNPAQKASGERQIPWSQIMKQTFAQTMRTLPGVALAETALRNAPEILDAARVEGEGQPVFQPGQNVITDMMGGQSGQSNFRESIGMSPQTGQTADLFGQEPADIINTVGVQMEQANLELDKKTQEWETWQMFDMESLSPQARQQLELMKAQTERDVTAIDERIQNLNATMQFVDTVLNPEQYATPEQLQAMGAAPTGMPVADALALTMANQGVEPGLWGPNDPDMQQVGADAEKIVQRGAEGEDVSADIDALTGSMGGTEAAAVGAEGELAAAQGQFDYATTVRNEINNLIAERQNIMTNFDEAKRITELERAGETDTQFALDVDPTPQGIYNEAMVNHVSDWLDSKENVSIRPQDEPVITQIVMQFAQYPDTAFNPENENYQLVKDEMSRFAMTYDLDPAEVENIINEARQRGSMAQQEIETIGEKKKLTPGSLGAVYAAFEQAAPLFGEERANMIANSPSLHKLIDTVSGGRAGASQGASMFGIGGLHKDTYEALGFNYDEIRGDVRKEMEALMRYLEVKYGGDPVVALQEYMDTKSWGRINNTVSADGTS